MKKKNYLVIESRGMGIQYEVFYGTLAECRKELNKYIAAQDAEQMENPWDEHGVNTTDYRNGNGYLYNYNIVKI